jgi:hypothetical protein
MGSRHWDQQDRRWEVGGIYEEYMMCVTRKGEGLALVSVVGAESANPNTQRAIFSTP